MIEDFDYQPWIDMQVKTEKLHEVLQWLKDNGFEFEITLRKEGSTDLSRWKNI